MINNPQGGIIGENKKYKRIVKIIPKEK